MLPNFVCAYPVSARIKILLAQCSDLDVVVNIASGRRSTYWCMAICAQITVAFIFAFHILVLFLFFFLLLLIAVLVIVYEYKHEQRFIEEK